MKGLKITACAMVMVFFLSVPVFSSEKKHQDGHHMAMHQMMVMMRDLMEIVKTISNSPTPEQKRKLSFMMKRLDKMINKHQKMMEHKHE